MTRRLPSPKSYANLVLSHKQAEQALDKARKRHRGQKRAAFLVQYSMTRLLAYEAWMRQFNVSYPEARQLGLPLTKVAA